MFATNPFKNPGALSVLGTPIDVSKVTCDAFILSGLTDHIVPWKACYATTRMLGGRHEFVLSSSGHVQSIVNPPTTSKARYFTSADYPRTADEWLAGARSHAGSWWEHWRDWNIARSGERREAPKTLGSARHPAGTTAPGTYVFNASER